MFSALPRRSTPLIRRHDNAYPIRIRFRQPEGGWGMQMDAHHAWIVENTAPGAVQSGPSTIIGGHVSIKYFRRIADAQAFLDAFPELEVADMVDSLGINFNRRSLKPH